MVENPQVGQELFCQLINPGELLHVIVESVRGDGPVACVPRFGEAWRLGKRFLFTPEEAAERALLLAAGQKVENP